ncbi:hypothetical protein FJT64_017057 [Amphibalanus amphitrite]|uniref:Chitin-binding type-2 domain-containing protein n=1 Tax=Amphibalanus amphitrite TaxID=1232801 RepID=A0A6A4XCY4_AMPAM|nr:hypothetical protein FJT64_017057 [Amphibalanus amphitrite]
MGKGYEQSISVLRMLNAMWRNIANRYGLYMDPESCEYYYSCNSWLAVHMSCYTSLVFNPQTSMCDYVQHVPSCQPQAVGDVVSPAEAN